MFIFKSKLYRAIANIFGYRPTSYPYISGDGFRSMADHIYDETNKFDGSKVSEGQIVFLKSEMMPEYFKNIHPKIKYRYKLITHNSDAIVGEKETKYIDDKIIKWYAQNNTFKHDKIIPVPIGIENRKWFINGWALEKFIKKNKISNNVNRKDRILFGFNVGTNTKERGEALISLRNCLFADEIKGRIIPSKYFELLNQYKYVASPEGNGPDCIRTWEAMILGVVPIIKNTSNNQILIQNSLPIILIDDWKNINSLNLNYDYNLKSDITMFDYWKDLINEHE